MKEQGGDKDEGYEEHIEVMEISATADLETDDQTDDEEGGQFAEKEQFLPDIEFLGYLFCQEEQEEDEGSDSNDKPKEDTGWVGGIG